MFKMPYAVIRSQSLRRGGKETEMTKGEKEKREEINEGVLLCMRERERQTRGSLNLIIEVH